MENKPADSGSPEKSETDKSETKDKKDNKRIDEALFRNAIKPKSKDKNLSELFYKLSDREPLKEPESKETESPLESVAEHSEPAESAEPEVTEPSVESLEPPVMETHPSTDTNNEPWEDIASRLPADSELTDKTNSLVQEHEPYIPVNEIPDTVPDFSQIEPAPLTAQNMADRLPNAGLNSESHNRLPGSPVNYDNPFRGMSGGRPTPNGGSSGGGGNFETPGFPTVPGGGGGLGPEAALAGARLASHAGEAVAAAAVVGGIDLYGRHRLRNKLRRNKRHQAKVNQQFQTTQQQMAANFQDQLTKQKASSERTNTDLHEKLDQVTTRFKQSEQTPQLNESHTQTFNERPVAISLPEVAPDILPVAAAGIVAEHAIHEHHKHEHIEHQHQAQQHAEHSVLQTAGVEQNQPSYQAETRQETEAPVSQYNPEVQREQDNAWRHNPYSAGLEASGTLAGSQFTDSSSPEPVAAAAHEPIERQSELAVIIHKSWFMIVVIVVAVVIISLIVIH